MKSSTIMKPLFLATFIFLGLSVPSFAQIQYRWLDIGDLHNFYASSGEEIEQGFLSDQQAGLRFPGIYQYQDGQAAKALWIGARNYTDASGNNFPSKVIHNGPRGNGLDNFFPLEFKLIAKYDKPQVLVDGQTSFLNPVEVDEVDPTMAADRMYYTKVNTTMGLTMERTISQFSQEYHDNYHLFEFTFTNTGNVDADDEIEMPNQTLTDVIFYFQNRWSFIAQTRFVIGNATGWGINTMNDRRGDGILTPDENPAENDIVAQFAWHGYFPNFAGGYDNIGAPIWVPATERGYLTPDDTTGRLGAYHFGGRAHIDATPNAANDPQPYTMDEIGSDDQLNFRNDPFNNTRMQLEYDKMAAGRTQRHAYIVEPTGLAGFLEPTGDPSLGTSGGWSAATGYGPYTIAPGESIKIVFAEAVAGIGHEQALITGREYKAGNLSDLEKNQVVFQGRDSLFQTFRRARENYENGFPINQPPAPPTRFEVNSGGDGVFLDWEYDGAEEGRISGFEIYRSAFRYDSLAVLVGTASPSERSFVDNDNNLATPPIRGINYFYYITAVGDPAENADGTYNPDGALRSSRYYTQTYQPARLLRPAGETMDQIRIVPNPYIASASTELRFEIEQGRDRIQFFEIPGRCTITIYTEIGERIATIEHTNGSGDNSWDLRTDARQRITSGVYIAVIENEDEGDEEFGKQVIKKFVVIL